VEVIEEVFETNRPAGQFIRQPFSALESAVGDQNTAHSVADKVFRGQLAHLPCPDKQHGFVREVPENLLRQLHRGEGDRNRRGGNPRFGADTLGNEKGLVQKTVEDQARGPVFSRIAVGSLYLAEDLGFADHQRVQAGSDTEHVADGVFAVIAVQMLCHLLIGQFVPFGEEPFDPGNPAGDIAGNGIHLNPVAGGQEYPFTDIRQCDQSAQGLLYSVRVESKLLPGLY